MSQENPLIGKTIIRVFLSEDGGAIRFDTSDEQSLIVQAEGDCCSHSWIEEIQGIEQLIGSPVVSVEEVGDMPDKPGNKRGYGEEEMAYYGCKISTEKGYALIDYRNSSNGYYGGNLCWPGSYFYDGVYGQNKSNEKWQEVQS